MNLLNMVLENSGMVDQLGKQFGLDGNQTQNAIKQLLPALAGGMKQRGAQQKNGLAQMVQQFGQQQGDCYHSNPQALAQGQATEQGNGILGQLLGSKEVSRELAGRASQNTGIESDILKKMLPLVATAAMSAIAKQQFSGNNNASGGGSGLLGSMLSSVLGGGRRKQAANNNAIANLLDMDGDGSMVDDIMGLAGKFLK